MLSLTEFDRQLRAVAASSGRPAPLLDHAPIAVVPAPVVVSAVRTRRSATVTATNGSAPAKATGKAALALLGSLGVTLTTDTPATLIAADTATLAVLGRLARASRPDGPHEAVAAHIGWWLDRADFPGGHAVVDLPGTCQHRWVTGADQRAERRTATWLAAHQLDTGGGELDVLALHRLVSDGKPLPGLSELADDTLWSFDAAKRAHGNGWDWRTSDTPGRAAVGLRARCDAADWYAAALLEDSRYRQRAACGGIVVTGTLTSLRPAVVECARLDARLRPGNDVLGWKGTAASVQIGYFRAAVQSSQVHHGQLRLTLSGVGSTPLAPGDPVTLRPAPPIPARQRSSRSLYRRLYGERRSWISTGRVPTITRRPVPLDVLVAAAESD